MAMRKPGVVQDQEGGLAPPARPRPLSVNRDGSLSIHVQLLEQLKYQIAERAWHPGAQLPPAHHLAGSLGINSNTVRAVYRDLERDGYVVSEHGRGTFVAAEAPSVKDEQQKVSDLMDEVVIHARHLGLSPDDLARLAFLRARMFAQESASSVRLLFTECNPAEVEFFAETISDWTNVIPSGFLLEELSQKPKRFFDGFDLLVTTLLHAEELQKVVGPGRRVLGLLTEPSYEDVVARLIPLPPRTTVALVCVTKPSTEKFISALRGTGLTHLRFWRVLLDDRIALLRAFRYADQIYVSRLVRARHKGPWPVDRPVHEYVTVLGTSALRLLRRRILEVAARSGRYDKGDGTPVAGPESLREQDGERRHA
jgi:GntR family transcriptional regulator